MKRLSILFLVLAIALMSVQNVDAKTRKRTRTSKARTSSITDVAPSYKELREALDYLFKYPKSKKYGLSVLYYGDYSPAGHVLYDMLIGKGVKVISHGKYPDDRIEFKVTSSHAFYYHQGNWIGLCEGYYFKDKEDRDNFFHQMEQAGDTSGDFLEYTLGESEDGWYEINGTQP